MAQIFQPTALELVLPWEDDEQQEQRFKNWLQRVLLPLLLFLIVIPWLPSVEKIYVPEDSVVKTKILLEPKVIEKPKVVTAPIPETPKPKPKPKKPKVKPVEERIVNAPPAPPVTKEKVTTKEDFAAAQGLSGLSGELGSLASSLDLSKMRKKNVSVSSRGNVEHSATQVLGKDSQTRIRSGVVVDDSAMRSDTIALAEHSSLVVEGASQGGVANGRAHQASYGSYKAGLRDMESIRRTLERTKSSVYSIYQQELLGDPDLAGKFTFKLVIEPDGKVSRLTLVASELGMEGLEKRILERLRTVNFGAKDVSATSVEYKFIFLPS